MRTILAALALTVSATGAQAQAMCAPYENLERVFIEQGIRLEGAGMIDLGDDVAAMQLWLTPGGDFAIISIDSNGIACMVAGGTDWYTPARL